MSEAPLVEPQPVAEPPVAVSADDVVAVPRRTGFSRVDLILALTAVFVSIVSLIVAIQNASTQREMVSASTWPFVTSWIRLGGNEHNDIQFGIGNSGVGPAKIQSYEVFYKGRPVTSARDLLRRCCGLPAERKAADAALNRWLSSTATNQTVLRSGEDQPVVVLRPDPENPALAMRFADALGDVTYSACYCSVLDECWKSTFGSTQAAKVRTCPAPKQVFEAGGP